ncbi:hypothetical protein J4050_07105 [Winogradskyella sp. DF17]|uniref:EpsG family protein n=1 Tax=Winogradskyella pelagia TaxID=2819984 RepID=A0ABS3T237_9FLAO|nr:hypothetical protein [Winogradskyella sp. DF17]MBO3116509.1 hypothetical protein [Winogradskyella sp. DF17]
MFKNVSLKGLIYVFFISLYVWIGYRLWYFDNAGNGFILGDWFVNYQDGGFKRRGLTGSVLFWVQDITGFGLVNMVYAIQMLLHFSLLFFIYKMLEVKRVSLFYFTLVISPLTFLFFFNDSPMVGRKELIFLNIFAYYLYLVIKDKLTVRKEVLIYGLLFVATFLHEITVFYIPYFILAHFLIFKKIDLKRYALFFLSVGLPAVVIFLFGAKTNEGQTLAILASRGVELQSYSIFSFTNDLFVQFDKYRNNVLGYGLYLPSLIIGLLHFGFYVKQETNYNYKRIMLYFFAIIAYSIPLFVLACDWGRWLQIHFTLFLLILTFSLPPLSAAKFKSKPILPFLGRNLQYGLLILFLSIWSVKHFNSGLSYDGLLTRFFLDLQYYFTH